MRVWMTLRGFLPVVLAVAMLPCLASVATARGNAPYSGPAPADRAPASLYKAYCANCHGAELKGDGPLAARLPVKMPDLTRGMRLASGPEGTKATTQDVLTVLERGVPNSPMPSYSGLFSKQELTGLARHVMGLMGADPSVPPLDLGPPPELSPDNVMEGAIIYARSGCAQCHGFDGKGAVESFIPRANDDGSPTRFPRLTHPVSFRSGGAAKEIALRIARGIPGTPMPAYRPALKEKEIWQVALYVETLAQVTNLQQLAQEWVDAPPEVEPRQHGEHLLSTMACVYCHRADGPVKGGQTSFDVGPLGTFHAGPMLPKSATESGASAVDVLRAALLEGEGADGRTLMPLAMPWTHMTQLAPSDIEALAAALEARPRAADAAPEPTHAGWLEQLIGKLTAVAGLTVLELRVGAPSEPVDGLHPRWMALGVMLVAGVFTFFLLVMAIGGPKKTRRRRTLTAFSPLPVGVALAVLMVWPAYDLRPLSNVRAAMSAELPAPQGIADDATRRVAMRGQQLVAAAPCAMCHTAQNPYRVGGASAPLAGGTRIRSQSFGRLYASNLTGDETGLGNYSREELRRAIRGGVGKDGRVLHWEAMPYDLSGAYTDEELEAIVTYLKSVPPVSHKVPPPEYTDDLEGMGISLYDYGE